MSKRELSLYFKEIERVYGIKIQAQQKIWGDTVKKKTVKYFYFTHVKSKVSKETGLTGSLLENHIYWIWKNLPKSEKKEWKHKMTEDAPVQYDNLRKRVQEFHEDGEIVHRTLTSMSETWTCTCGKSDCGHILISRKKVSAPPSWAA